MKPYEHQSQEEVTAIRHAAVAEYNRLTKFLLLCDDAAPFWAHIPTNEWAKFSAARSLLNEVCAALYTQVPTKKFSPHDDEDDWP